MLVKYANTFSFPVDGVTRQEIFEISVPVKL